MEREPRYQKQLVDYTSPAWRLTAVALVFGGIFFGGWAAQILGLVDQFSTFFVLTLFSAVLFWAKKRPDRLKRRFGPWGKIVLAIQESADDIRASIYARSIYYGVLIGAAYAVLVIVTKALVVAVATSLYAWQITAALGCLVAAAVVAPQFFQSAAKRMSIPDETGTDYPEEPRRVNSEEVRETLPEAQNRSGDEEEEEDSRRADASAIGFYDEEGNQLSQEEFEALFANSDGEDE